MEQTVHTGLVRAIRRWDLVALGINVIIGAGIFGLPSRIYGLTGVWSLVAYLICALLIILIILCFAEVGSRFEGTGGPYLYTRMAFGPLVGFEVGWLMWLARLTAFAALCNLVVGSLSYLWPAAGVGLWRVVTITAVVVSLTVVNVIGVRESALASDIFTVGKLALLVSFVAVGLFFVSPGQFSFSPRPDYGSFSTAVLLLVFAFSGFEMTVIPSGEIRDPQRHIPFALLTATGVVVLLYLLIQFVCIGTLPELARSERPLIDASSHFVGAAGATIMSVGAMFSVTGTLNTVMLTAPRLMFAMAEQGQLPRILAATHWRFHTPWVAILVSAAIMLAFTLFGTFISALTISTVIRLLVYIATCLSVPVLRRRGDVPRPAFRVPAGTAVSLAATVLSVWLLSNSTWNDAWLVGTAAALGLLIHLGYLLVKRAPLAAKEIDPVGTPQLKVK
ncbi:MAG TPA: APC family permease [Blastocatellia bacterium]|nr:APC family permease [Blastocatellia bacterium]